MRASSFVVFSALVACGNNPRTSDAGATPDVPDTTQPTTIHISSGIAPALVAVRDGVAGPWRPAVMQTPTMYEATVRGPYTVAVVCDILRVINITFTARSWFTWQAARTLDDSHDLVAPCNTSPVEHNVTGVMAQAGFLQIGNTFRGSATDAWSFHLFLADGSYDLFATTADRIAIRRGVVVDGDLAVTPNVDAVQEGTALADVAFTITNGAADEELQARVGLETPTTRVPARIYQGAITTAKAAPDAAMIASDRQTASLRALKGTALRALRRPFHVGGDTTFTLPIGIGDPRWTIDNAQITAGWTALPDLHALSLDTSGTSSDVSRGASYQLDLSASYLATTGITQARIDTDIPGYRPEWKVNFATSYVRDMFSQRVADGVISTSSISEQFNPMAPVGPIAPRPLPEF